MTALRSATIFALLLSVTLIAPVGRADAAAGCAGTTTADLGLTQSTSSSSTAPWVVTYVIAVTNYGPCNLPGLVLQDDLSGMTPPTSWRIANTSPRSWVCTPGSGPATQFSCALTANVGVPGTVTVTLEVTWDSMPSSTTNRATALQVGGMTDPTPDPHPNATWASFFFDGGTIQDGNQDPTVGAIVSGSHKVVAPAGTTGGAQVNRTNCDAAVPDCFDAVQIIVEGFSTPQEGRYLFLTFTYNANETNGKKLNQITIVHIRSDGAHVLANCGRTTPAFGCISDRIQFKSGGSTWYQIIIKTPTNDSWDA